MLTHGVPQGSTSGPLLFILYINDLTQVINGIGIKLHADDPVFYINSPDIESLVAKMNEAVSLFREWCCFNKLTINNKKSKRLLFSNKPKKIHESNVRKINNLSGNEPLEVVREYKYLGDSISKVPD